ncbi:MAG: hypothetical protein GX060_05745 [Firmicutes bacterium]|nr:hypothetical protein [Bacillota bacterium]
MKRKIRCRPLPMPPVFAWGDTTVNWSRDVDEYMAIRSYNRMCDLLRRRQRRR